MDWLFGGSSATQASIPDTKLRIQTAVAGKPIPVGCGQDRFAGNIIWYGDFQSTSQSVGGKGGVVGGGKGGGQSFTYTAAVLFGLCEGPIDSIIQVWDQQKNRPLSNIGATVLLGDYAQSPWGYLTTNHPGMADNYRGMALVGLGPAQLGTSASLPNWTWEVLQTIKNGIPGHPDADPKDWITNLLTNQYWSIHFPNANLDALTSYSNWCKATGMVISDTIVSQQSLSSYLQKLLEATCSEFVWSGGVLTIVPYGDVVVTANGATYTPAADTGISLGDDDFLPLQTGSSGLPGNSRVQITRPRAADFDNWVQVDYLDRSNSYNHTVAEAKDELAIELLGYPNIKAGVRSYNFFKLQAAALVSAHLQLGRQLVRNQYQFSIGRQYLFLDPMDIVTITDSNAGLVNKRVRIKEISEQQDGSFSIVAEEVLQGTGTPYNYGANNPAAGPPICSDPGATVYAVIDAPLCAVSDGPALIIAAGSPFTTETSVYISATGAGTWMVPPGVEDFTVELWGPGGDNGNATAGGGGAYSRKRYTGVSPGTVYNLNVEPHNGSGADVWTWFSSLATQKAHGGNNGGAGGDPAKCIGDVVYGGGNGGGIGGGGGGAGGPKGPGRNGGNIGTGIHPGAGAGGGQGGGTDGADGLPSPSSHGGDGGKNAAGLPGGLGGAPGTDATNPGSGGGGADFNSSPGGAGADDPDGGGAGGGGATRNTGSGIGGHGGFPGGGAGIGSPQSGPNAAGASGGIKISYGSCNLWGSAILWVSTDGGSTYHQAGTIPGPSPIGVLTASFASGSDPDTTHSLQVDLTESQGTLQTYATSDADAGRSRAMVNNELIDFSKVTLTGSHQYTLDTYIRRGQLGTAAVSHSAGETFAQLGANSIVVKYPASLIGTTIHFKFTALNTFGGFQQSLASVPDNTLLLVGPGSPSAPASLTVVEPVAASGSVTLTWPAAAGCAVTGYNVNWNTGGADTVVLVNSNTLSTVISGLAAGAHNFKVQAVNSAGLTSGFTTTAFTVT